MDEHTRQHSTNPALLLLAGAGAGLLVSYFLDPDRGRRRRARLRDRAVSALHDTRDARNPARGLDAHAASRLEDDPPTDRFELAQRNWAPAPRFLVGTLGSALVAYGLLKRGAMRTPSTAIGTGLLLRSIANRWWPARAWSRA